MQYEKNPMNLYFRSVLRLAEILLNSHKTKGAQMRVTYSYDVSYSIPNQTKNPEEPFELSEANRAQLRRSSKGWKQLGSPPCLAFH